MLFKMLGIERAYAQQSESLSLAKPRQLFVTRSRNLANSVEESFSKLLESLTVAKKTNREIKDLAEEKKRQLHGQQAGSALLYDADDDVMWKATLPSRFSLLRDEHFPLFLTFDRVGCFIQCDASCEMILNSPSHSLPNL